MPAAIREILMMFQFTKYRLIAVLFLVGSHCLPTVSFANDTYIQLLDQVDVLMKQQVVNPELMDSDEYRTLMQVLYRQAKEASSEKEFITSFNTAWKSGPFSHVNLIKGRQNARQLAFYLDQMNVGGDAVSVSYKQGVAILTVRTMMGRNTVDNIRKAYQQIKESQSKALIIDLRDNEGGTFAVRPLVSHLIDRPILAGHFRTRRYDETQHKSDTQAPVWSGWSINEFWTQLQLQPRIDIRFEPKQPAVTIPTYVLTNGNTASASEMAIAALKDSGRVTVIGEATAGRMLSQKPYDLPGGFILFIPIGDYHMQKSGRIEGNPIKPDVEVPSEQALNVALERLALL